MPNTLFPLQVAPTIPPAIGRLTDLTRNFLFSWFPTTGQLFRSLDSVLWRKTEGNPKLFLRCVDQGLLDHAANDPKFLSAYQRVLGEFDRYVAEGGHADGTELVKDDLIAYFCAEFGFHESFPIYSGGLGILAGDHCKTASDLSLPFVGVGLLYRQGYFNQRIDRNGQQVPEYPYIDPRNTPLTPALAADGKEVRVSCPFGERSVAVRVWQALVGRVTVLFLDTDVEENTPDDRKIAHVLYGGVDELRLQQETILGVGGVRALRALGPEARPCGTSTRVTPRSPCSSGSVSTRAPVCRLQRRSRRRPRARCSRRTRRSARATTCFRPTACAKHFETFPAELGITPEQMLDLGRSPEQRDSFSMTRLAIRGSSAMNGVSKIHGGVTSRLYQANWPDIPPAGESGRLRDERRARADVPAPSLGDVARPALGRQLARAAHGSDADRSNSSDPGRAILVHEPERQDRSCCACCASGCPRSTPATA